MCIENRNWMMFSYWANCRFVEIKPKAIPNSSRNNCVVFVNLQKEKGLEILVNVCGIKRGKAHIEKAQLIQVFEFENSD